MNYTPTDYRTNSRPSLTDTEDEDSGVVADCSDFSSPEDDLTFDFEYEDLLLELNDGGISEIPCKEDLDACQEELETLQTLETDASQTTNTPLPEVHANHSTPKQSTCVASGKVEAFSREQARQWRRKRILNSQNVTHHSSTLQKPNNLKALLPLPGKLRPKIEKKLDRSAEKLLDPLQGGEKIRSTRGLQPMKLRALPESFWKEPSALSRSNFSVLPPIFSAESNTSTEEVMNVRPVTPPDERSRSPRHSPRRKKSLKMMSQPDTELLFSLFDHLENKVDERLIVRRGRPKKTHIEKIPPPPRTKEGDDPCILDDLATKLFPDLSLSNNKQDKQYQNFAIVKIVKGERTIEFPAIHADQNYSAILNVLVTHM